MSSESLRIGFIPLTDATALIVAVDKGFTAKQGLSVDLVREVSWSNMRDKLNIGVFDAAHLIAPVAIASSLGIGHRQGADRGAVCARRERQCHHGVAGAAQRADYWRPTAGSDRSEGLGASAGACRRRAAQARRRPADLRHDVSVLHPQLSSALLDGGGRRRSGRGCAPRRAAAALYGGESFQTARSTASASARRGIRSRSISASATSCISAPTSSRGPPEKVLAVRAAWSANRDDVLKRLVGALAPGGRFHRRPGQSRRSGCAPRRTATAIGVAPEIIERTFKGRLRISPGGRLPQRPRLHPDRPRRRGAPRAGARRMALRANGALGSGAVVAGSARCRQGVLPPGSLRSVARSKRRTVGDAVRPNRRFHRPAIRRQRHRRSCCGVAS